MSVRVAGAGTAADPLRLAGGVVAAWTGRAEGDLGARAGGELATRRRGVVDRPWSWVRQVHGAGVVVVGVAHDDPDDADYDPDDAADGAEGDAIVATPRHRGALAIFVADCAPVALASPQGVMAAVHAGWRGVAAGVLTAAADVMRTFGAAPVYGALGPCIHPSCYEFGAADLAAVEEALGGPVAARTSTGAPALDLPAAVHLAAARAGIEMVFDHETCTACSPHHFSHRAAADSQRQALLVWRP